MSPMEVPKNLTHISLSASCGVVTKSSACLNIEKNVLSKTLREEKNETYCDGNVGGVQLKELIGTI